MRILVDGRFITDHYPGIARAAFNLLRALPAVDPRNEYWLAINPGQRLADAALKGGPKLSPTLQGGDGDAAPQDGVPSSRPNSRYDLRDLAIAGVKLVDCRAAPGSPLGQIELPRLARRLDAAVFHTPHFPRPLLMPCPVVATIYDVNPARYPASLPSRRARIAFRAAVRLAVTRSDRIITASEHSRRELVRLFDAAEDRVAVTYLAADLAYRSGLAQEPAAGAVRERLRLPHVYLLYLGINKPLKNLERLLEAYALLAADPTVGALPPLVLAGREDPRYPGPRQLAARSGLADRVQFLGDVAEADLPYLYAGAMAFVFPSLAEGFGLPPLEAMASGVPVVTSRSSSLPEVCGAAAVYFDPYDPADIAAAVRRVVEQPDLRRQLAIAGIERAATFSWERTAAATRAVYESASC